MKWAAYVAIMGEIIHSYSILVGSSDRKRPPHGNLRLYGKIILKSNFNMGEWWVPDSAGSDYDPEVGSSEYCKEASTPIKGGEFRDWLSDCQIHKKESAQRISYTRTQNILRVVTQIRSSGKPISVVTT